MECYRRAMIGEQSIEGRRENLSQANKLSRFPQSANMAATLILLGIAALFVGGLGWWWIWPPDGRCHRSRQAIR
jgi:hypothetical protein